MEAALRTMEQVTTDHPANPEAWGRKAELLYNAGRVEDAEKALQKALEISPNYPFGYLLRGSFRRAEGEAPRVAPSRARSAPKPRSKMPLITVANSSDRDAALAGLERWKAKFLAAAAHLAVDDVLVDSMRGRSSTWTRIRVNLRHVPEDIRPLQETPDPDDDPTRQWRESRAGRASKKTT